MHYCVLSLMLLVGCTAMRSGGDVAPRRNVEVIAPAISPVATALGLGATATEDQIAALERNCKSTGTFEGQACGVRSFSNIYSVAVPATAQAPVWLEFNYVQRAARPLVSLDGPDFAYRRQGELFVYVRREAAR